MTKNKKEKKKILKLQISSVSGNKLESLYTYIVVYNAWLCLHAGLKRVSLSATSSLENICYMGVNCVYVFVLAKVGSKRFCYKVNWLRGGN